MTGRHGTMTGLTGRMGTTSAVIAAVGLVACLVVTPSAMAQEADGLGDVFGQSSPSDTLGKGEREIASEVGGRFGRADGTYRVLDGKTQLGFGIVDGFSVTPGLLTTTASIEDVSGLENHRGLTVDGLALELKGLLLDRNKGGLGLAILAEPFVVWTDGETGNDVHGRGVEVRVAADWALVPKTLYANVNAAYGLSRVTDDGVTSEGSEVLVSGALAYRVTDTVFLGAELRYARAYEGLGLERLQGEAVYLGPTLFWQPDPKIAITATWSPQVWGRDVGGADGDNGLDLMNFERHQAKLKVAVPF